MSAGPGDPGPLWPGGWVSCIPGCCLGPARLPSSPDAVCLQEAVHSSSVEGQINGPRAGGAGWGEPGGKTPVRQASLGASIRSPPRSPRPASVRTRKHAFGQRCVSSRPLAPRGEEAEAPDPADEEVSHITSSARSPSGSPDARGAAGAEPDLHEFYGVEARGFLEQPGPADEQRRPSGEQGGGDGRPEAREVKARAPEAEPASGARRKKKMSPPCISVDPPAEEEGAARPPAAAEGSSTLRRRTPSCEAAPHRDSLEPSEGAGADPAAKGERRTQACRGEHLTVPSFAFEPLDVGGPGGDLFLDGGHSVAPEPRASFSGAAVPPEPHKTEPSMPSSDPPEKGRGLHLKVLQSPPKRAGSPPATPSPGDRVDKPV